MCCSLESHTTPSEIYSLNVFHTEGPYRHSVFFFQFLEYRDPARMDREAADLLTGPSRERQNKIKLVARKALSLSPA